MRERCTTKRRHKGSQVSYKCDEGLWSDCSQAAVYARHELVTVIMKAVACEMSAEISLLKTSLQIQLMVSLKEMKRVTTPCS